MSLKGVTSAAELHNAKRNQEFILAVAYLKLGKRNAKRKLYKCVKKGTISYKYYEELIEKYRPKTKEKRKRELWFFGYPIKEYLPLLHFLLCHLAAYIILESADIDNIGVGISSLYLATSFFLYFYSNEQEKQNRNREITNLRREINQLENTRAGDKFYIELLEKQLENKKNN